MTEQQITKLVERLISERFYGDLILAFQDGEVVLIRENKTIKPQSLYRKDRYADGKPK